MFKKNILIYGATGSIGDSVLNLIRNNKQHFNVVGVKPKFENFEENGESAFEVIDKNSFHKNGRLYTFILKILHLYALQKLLNTQS